MKYEPTKLTNKRLIKIDNIVEKYSVYCILQQVDSDIFYIYKTLLDLRITDPDNPYIKSMINVLETNITPFSPEKRRID